jgi:SAM-dependent methyltransferase
MFEKVQALLETYPRVRPPLGGRYEELYVGEYKRSRSGGKGLPALVANMEAWMHRQVLGAAREERILELGAGTLNHVPYEKRTSVYDVVEPFQQLWENSPNRDQVTAIYKDISDIPKDRSYDRIISVAVLEHLTDLPSVLAQCGLMLRADGEFKAGIPSEGGFLWSFGWRMTTGLSFRLRTGLSYEVIMRHEHVNCSDEIVALTRYLFKNVSIRRFPLPAKNLSLYTALGASHPIAERCCEVIRRRTGMTPAPSGNCNT